MAAAPPPPVGGEKPDPFSKRPKDTAFKQQRLLSWQPVWSPPWVIFCFAILALLFLPLGGAIIAVSDSVVEVKHRYDHIQACPPESRTEANDWACEPLHVRFDVPRTMVAPVFIYYELSNFYQNHRRYAKSRNDLQLVGESVPLDSLGSDCDPFRHPGQYIDLSAEPNRTVKFDANDAAPPVDIASIAYSPCGLIAWSMFNDTFDIVQNATSGTQTLLCKGDNFRPDGQVIDTTLAPHCKKDKIEWPTDRGGKYNPPSRSDRSILTSRGWPQAPNGSEYPLAVFVQKGYYVGELGHRIPDVEDLDLMVWMRLASLSTFRKLYRRIEVDVPAGQYDFVIHQRYDIRSFQGKKSVVLTTSSWVGGRNYMLGGLYIATGSVCLILALGFLAKYFTTPRRVGRL